MCPKVFSYPKGALEHENVHTGAKPFSCEHCGCSYPLSRTLTDHIHRKHSKTIPEEKMHNCIVCSKEYKSESGLNRHYASNHQELGYDYRIGCDICEETFCSIKQLIRHKLTHPGFKPYECDTCNKSFSSKGQLKTHQRVHTGEKPYVCNYCDKRFAQHAPYLYHLKTHTGEKAYFCVNCKRGFIAPANLRNHMNKCHVKYETTNEIYIKSEPFQLAGE
uniref:Zinc finger protein 394-like n=1 Tax=Diabrotica virgifera virgifera TaxID=50390 RepID=A0A6P7F1J2_DIAVI